MLRQVICALCVLSISWLPLVAEDDGPLPFDNMGPYLGNILSEYYYDRSRIRPKVMVERGLRALEASDVAIETTWVDGQLTVAGRGRAARYSRLSGIFR